MYLTAATSTLPDHIRALRNQLATAIPQLEEGAFALRSVDVTGPDRQAQLMQGTRDSGAAWKPAYATLAQVRAAATQLGTDPLAAAARAAIDGAGQVADRGLDAMGRAYMQFWSNPDPLIADRLVSYVAGQSDRTTSALRDAVAALDALVAAPRP